MKSRWTRSSWLSRPEGTKRRAGSREAAWFHCRVPAGGGGGEGGAAGEKTKLNLERLAGSSGLQSPCLAGGWGRHSGGSMALGSLDWLHQTLEGEVLLKIQGFWESKKKSSLWPPELPLLSQLSSHSAGSRHRPGTRSGEHPLGIWPAWEIIQLIIPEGPQGKGWAGSVYSEECTQQAHPPTLSFQSVCVHVSVSYC